MEKRRNGFVLTLVLAILVIAGWVPSSDAQQWKWPEKGTNLTVLPKGTGGTELADVMKGFTHALGVRCEHCHVGQGDLSNFDFASDEKKTKKTARMMLGMVRAINDDFISKIGQESPIRVSCETCHHGQPRPERLQDVLLEAWRSGGIEELRKNYIQLRAQYYGSYTYDFSENMLVSVAEAMPSNKQDDAIAVLELNVQMYPQSWRTWHVLGEVHLLKKDKPAAIDAFSKSLEINPDNSAAKQRIDELGGEQ